MVGDLELSDTLGVTNKGADSSSLESYNADELGLTVWREGGGILIKIVITDSMLQQGGEERDTAVMLHLQFCPHHLPVQGGPWEHREEGVHQQEQSHMSGVLPATTSSHHPASHTNHGVHIIRMDINWKY